MARRRLTHIPEEKPWLIQPHETETEYAPFLKYLHMEPPRTPSKVAAMVGKSRSLMYQLSCFFLWAARARAYDRHINEIVHESLAQEKARLRRDHLRPLEKARVIAEDRLQTILDTPELLDEMSARDVISFLKESITMERLIIGEATDRVENVDIDYEALTPEESQALIDIAEASNARKDRPPKT